MAVTRQTKPRSAGRSRATDRRKEIVDPGSTPISVDEAIALYEGEWILMRVTALDQDHIPARGHILVHSRSHARVCKELAKLPPASQEPDAHYYVFQAYPYLRTGAEMRQALERARETGAAGAWRR